MGKPRRSEFFRRHSPGPRHPPSFKPCALSRLSREHENPLRSLERRGRNAPEVEIIGFAASCFLQLALVLWGWGGALSGAPTLGRGELGTWRLSEGAWPRLAPPGGGASARAASLGGEVRPASASPAQAKMARKRTAGREPRGSELRGQVAAGRGPRGRESRSQTAKGESKARREEKEAGESEAEPGLGGEAGGGREVGRVGEGEAGLLQVRARQPRAHLGQRDGVPVTAGGRRHAAAPGLPDVAAPLPSVPGAMRPERFRGARPDRELPCSASSCSASPAGSSPASW